MPALLPLRACLSVRFQGFTPTPQYRPSASSRLWPARPAALCLPDPCGLGSDSHGGEVFSGKLLEFLTQTGSKRRIDRGQSLPCSGPAPSPSRSPYLPDSTPCRRSSCNIDAATLPDRLENKLHFINIWQCLATIHVLHFV